MKLHEARCANCSAPLNLHRETERCRCEHCDTEFLIEWGGSGTPTLTAVAALLSKVHNQARFLEAGQRLQYIAVDLNAAAIDVAEKEAMLGAAEAGLATVKEQQAKELLATAATFGALVVIAIALFGIGVSRIGEDKWGWQLLGAGLACVVAWGAVEQLRADATTVPPERQKAEETLAEARDQLDLAKAKLLDFSLEQKYCQQVVRNHRVRT
jgi:hypothetical protein